MSTNWNNFRDLPKRGWNLLNVVLHRKCWHEKKPFDEEWESNFARIISNRTWLYPKKQINSANFSRRQFLLYFKLSMSKWPNKIFFPGYVLSSMKWPFYWPMVLEYCWRIVLLKISKNYHGGCSWSTEVEQMSLNQDFVGSNSARCSFKIFSHISSTVMCL